MAIKFGRPIEARTHFAPVETEAPMPTASTCPSACAATGAANGRAAWCAKTQLTTDDLIWPLFVMDGDNARTPVAVDARRRAAVGRPGGARGRTRGQAHHPLPRALPLYRSETCATRPAAKRSTRTIWSAAPSAPSRRKCRRSASSATWRSIPSPATAMTACCATASSSTTRPSPCWSSRRSCRRRPAATSSRPPT